MIDQLTAITVYVTSYVHLYKLAVSLTIFLIFWGFKNLFTNYIFHFMLSLINRNKLDSSASFLNAVRNPLKNLIVLIGAYFALQNYLPNAFNPILNDIFRTGIIVLFANAIYSLVLYYAANESEINKLVNREVDKILIPFLSKVFRAIVLALAFVAIASTWGYDVNGFIAGLGLGGLAFALAAKDLLANIFSGIVIITDKPFSIGDWIKTNEVEGTIEDINFRSTKIRAFDQALVTVPNSTLVNTPIINFTKRLIRRVTFEISLKYNTPSYKLKACISKIEDLLRNHPDVDQQTIFVKFDSLDKSSLNIFVYFFTATVIWGEYLNIKQDINFKIMEILENEGVSFAFPSTSVYVETPIEMKAQEK
ncbi:MAG: mechanosensitive ion channel family protein [Veillonellaceae bacterium]|jgi:MscS family membrane protein|nr:mechanosensitive ion channel family protein [Veillonellaceae bacterium]